MNSNQKDLFSSVRAEMKSKILFLSVAFFLVALFAFFKFLKSDLLEFGYSDLASGLFLASAFTINYIFVAMQQRTEALINKNEKNVFGKGNWLFHFTLMMIASAAFAIVVIDLFSFVFVGIINIIKDFFFGSEFGSGARYITSYVLAAGLTINLFRDAGKQLNNVKQFL